MLNLLNPISHLDDKLMIVGADSCMFFKTSKIVQLGGVSYWLVGNDGIKKKMEVTKFEPGLGLVGNEVGEKCVQATCLLLVPLWFSTNPSCLRSPLGPLHFCSSHHML